MEAALVSGFIKTILPRILSLVEEKYKLQNKLKSDILFLERELRMIAITIDEQILQGGKNHGAVLSLSMEELRELAHQMEDCVDRFLYHVTRGRQAASWLPRIIRSLKTMLSCQRLAAEVQLLKKVPEEVHQREERYKDFAASYSSCRHVELSSFLSGSYPHTLKADLVGIDSPRDELMEQLAEEAEGLPKLPKVISIVGVHGSGKTVLAREVYQSDVGIQFSLRAWVSAADRGPREVLMGILQELGRQDLGNSSIYQLIVVLSERLKGKRYLIVIDDMQKDLWGTIEAAFQEQNNVSSRVMVTTTIQSVANACSSSNGYVHKMKRLGDKHSEQLLAKKACQKIYLGYMRQELKEVLKKCDGNPLALVSVGQLLRKKGWPTDPNCEHVCRHIHHHLEKDETLEPMRRVLLQTFYSIEAHSPKVCLLYFGMFPRGQPIRSKSLMRKWLAEGFLEQQSSCRENFNTLIDRNIIEPIGVSNNEQIKTCRTYGMMHEFFLQMSTSQDIITLFSENMARHKYVRRLSLHNTGTTGDSLDIDLSLVRSLLVIGEAGKAILNFQKYQLLKVLDLEECTDLSDDHLKDICNLLLLRYLSLGVTVNSLPKDIGKLKLLETLDLRKTKVKMLPLEVLLLPCLVYLFGKKLRLSHSVKNMKKSFLEAKSNLETLSGFTTDGGQGFSQIMSHMMNLRKVKIWFEKSEGSTNSSDLKDAIQNFIHDDKEECHDPRSLSLNFYDFSENILNLLKSPCYLRSLKLKGKFLDLPQFVMSMRGLQELCISSTKLTARLLADLSNLTGLQHLKLIADELEDFIIKDLAFPVLLHLCIVLRSSNTLPKIEEGAMPYLTSLKLTCKDLVGLADIKINYLRCLKEVTLDPTVTPQTIHTWKKAAMEHPNRPKILLLNPVDESESEPADGSVPSTFTESETGEQSITSKVTVQENDSRMLVRKGSSDVQNKIKNLAVQSSSNGEQNSAFADMGYSEVSVDSTELSIPHNNICESNASSC